MKKTILMMIGLFILSSQPAMAMPDSELFPRNETFDINECQRWTDEVRDFNVSKQNKAEKVTVLMYHRVVPEDAISRIHKQYNGNLISEVILQSDFQEQIEFLKEEGYTTLTLKELAIFIDGKLDIPEKSVVLTFDDGFIENTLEVAPTLRANGFNAASFVITGAVRKEDYEYDPSKYQYYTLEDMQNSCDIFEFESHTYHFHKRTNRDKAYLVALTSDLIKKDIATSIYNLDGNKQAFAAPYGAYNDRVVDILKDLGIHMAFTVNPADVVPGTNIYEIPRREVKPDDSLEDFKEKIGFEG
ncbi:polysaccharide deacetylase family protein [Gracilibacillus caseinilyticus]|uniref:Polysaccharide deacetylase family protein n=1 Tax=Gracilibacillus caseinilyticus TaxID=2932256 RepID=A0ABY4EQC7_9BACI|nr:polysaccharide deacetylase family protein [Gracilibacillus caseinilyticus]UOQ46642.1 polysaccharide deacetylase family protein [Gracilibacillus caseinilyticus]